jgi:hypothetical protein
VCVSLLEDEPMAIGPSNTLCDRSRISMCGGSEKSNDERFSLILVQLRFNSRRFPIFLNPAQEKCIRKYLGARN